MSTRISERAFQLFIDPLDCQHTYIADEDGITAATVNRAAYGFDEGLAIARVLRAAPALLRARNCSGRLQPEIAPARFRLHTGASPRRARNPRRYQSRPLWRVPLNFLRRLFVGKLNIRPAKIGVREFFFRSSSEQRFGRDVARREAVSP